VVESSSDIIISSVSSFVSCSTCEISFVGDSDDLLLIRVSLFGVGFGFDRLFKTFGLDAGTMCGTSIPAARCMAFRHRSNVDFTTAAVASLPTTFFVMASSSETNWT